MNAALRRICLSLVCLVTFAHAAHATQWIEPTPEELKMTSAPEAPGATAIYLNREEITDDHLHYWRTYVRLKVLTEGGKDYANVEVGQYNSYDNGSYKIEDIAGRTIHPDGTIIPFTGKPYEKLIQKGRDYKYTAKVFTLPSVEVGSIIEYTYDMRYDDSTYFPARWIIQSDLFTRHAHYEWLPTSRELISKDEKGEVITSGISWSPILPKGVELTNVEIPSTRNEGPERRFELKIDNVPPLADEEYMPPIRSLGYRVAFYYTAYTSRDNFWKDGGKRWSKSRDHFIGPGSKVRAAVNELVQPGDTEDQKLRKIYAAVLKLENTVYTRQRSRSEEHADGLGEVKNTDDVWERKRGTDDQLAELFVAMARAAGFKAYVMGVTNRDKSLFLPSYLSLDQLNDDVAIVNVGGKDQFFDPGQPFCPFGDLAWKHTMTQGLRQTENGAETATTPAASYKQSRTDRVAALTLDDHGIATGTVTLTFLGSPALQWRQRYLLGDAESLNHEFENTLQQMMPGGMEIKVKAMQNVDDYEKPLIVNFDVKGAIASSAGKRVLVPADIFVSSAKPTFSHEKREQAVYFPYASTTLDLVRVTFPAGYTIESAPPSENIPYKYKDKATGHDMTSAAYELKTEQTPNSVLIRRTVLMGDILFTTDQYPGLYSFFSKFEARDHEPTVLKPAAQTASN